MAGDEQGGQADAGGGVALAGFADEAGVGHGGKLAADGVEQPGGSDDHGPLGRHEPGEPVDGVFEQRLLAGQRQELLGQGRPAGGPEARAGSAGHHDRVQHRSKIS